jgi:hypothetical protein
MPHPQLSVFFPFFIFIWIVITLINPFPFYFSFMKLIAIFYTFITYFTNYPLHPPGVIYTGRDQEGQIRSIKEIEEWVDIRGGR